MECFGLLGGGPSGQLLADEQPQRFMVCREITLVGSAHRKERTLVGADRKERTLVGNQQTQPDPT
eukprot:762649-Hanusia_phi.AAC.1